MKKITLFFSMCLMMLIGAVSANAQAITSLEELSNDAAYAIKSERGNFVYVPSRSETTAFGSGRYSDIVVDESTANCQWAILKTEKGYYLYSVGAKKFLYKEDAGVKLTATPVASDVNFLAATGDTKDTYPWVVAFGEHQVNMSMDQGTGLLTNWNKTDDKGNMLSITKVAGFDATEALAVIAEFEDPTAELVRLIAEKQAIVDAAVVGTGVGYCIESSKAAAIAAIAKAQAVVDDEMSDAADVEAAMATLETEMAAAVAAFEYNPIVTGLYQIVSCEPRFAENQGVEKALLFDGSNLAWGSLDVDAPGVYWNIEVVDTVITVKNVVTESYLHGTGFSTEANEVEFNLLAAGQFHIVTNGTYVHANNHGNGAGISGNIVSWMYSGANSASAWKLEKVDAMTDAAQAQLEAVKAELQAKIELEVAKATEEYAAVRARIFELMPGWATLANAGTGLITDATQFSSNADHNALNPDAKDGMGFAGLIDGSTAATSFFHSAWQNSPAERHYLDVAMPSATEDFFVYIHKRTGTSNNLNRPADVTISVSGDNGATYTEIARLTDMFADSQAVPATISAKIPAGYTNYRFTVNNTNSPEKTNNGQPYFTASEFQFYAVPAEDGDLKTAIAILDEFYAIKRFDDVLALQSKLEDLYYSALLPDVLANVEDALALQGIGYPKADCEERLALEAAYALNPDTADYAKTLVEAYEAYEAAFLDVTKLQMPEDGKAYTITNVQKSGATKQLYYTEANGLTVGADNEVYAGDSATFICRVIEDKYVFVWPNGKFMNYEGKGSTSTGAESVYNLATQGMQLVTTNDTKLGTFRLQTTRDGSTAGSIVITSAGVFDGYGHSTAWADGYSNLFSIAEVADFEAPAIALESVNVESGEYAELVDSIVVKFSNAVFAVNQVMFYEQLPRMGTVLADSCITVADSSVTVKVPAELLEGKYTANYMIAVENVFGQEATARLSYTKPMPTMEFVSATPATGVVESLDSIYVVFNDPTLTIPEGWDLGACDLNNVVLLNEAGNTVATVTPEFGKAYDDILIDLPEVISAAGTYTLVIPAATVSNNNGNVFNEEIRVSYTIEAAPAAFGIVGVTPAEGTVSELSVIELTFNEAVTAFAMMNPVVKNAAGDKVASLTAADITYGADGLTAILTLPTAITASGEYTLVIAANTFFPAPWDQARPNAETSFKFTIESAVVVPPLTVAAVYPGEGEVEALPTSVEVVFSEAIVGATAFVRTDLQAKGEQHQLEDLTQIVKTDNVVKFNLSGNWLTGASTYTLTIEARDAHGCVATYGDFPGYVSLTYTLPAPEEVNAAKLEISDVAVTNGVTSISSAIVTVLDSAAIVVRPDSTVEDKSQVTIPDHEGVAPIVLLNADSAVVATAVLGYGEGWNQVELLFDPVIAEAGTYTLVIPEGALWNDKYDGYLADYGVSLGATYNAYTEVMITITEDGVVSGINGVAVAAPKNEVYYDLTGRVVTNPVKGGIYIVNGKKVVK